MNAPPRPPRRKPAPDRTLRPPTTAPRRRPGPLLIVLGVAALAFLATLPWQMRTWRDVARLKAQTAGNRSQIRALQEKRAELTAAEAALRASPRDPAAELAAATALVHNGDVPGAAAQLHALEPATVHSADLSDGVAGLYQQIGYTDRAVALARQELRLAPDSPAALVRLAYLDLQVGRQTEGMSLLHRAVSLAPQTAEPHVALALAYSQVNAFKDAQRELTLARRLRPDDWHIVALLADNLHELHHTDQALQLLAQAQRLAPTELKVYTDRAAFLLEQAQSQAHGGPVDVAPAVSDARQALALDPASAAPHYILGQAALAAGRPADARREWEQALALDPAYPGLRYNLGRLRVRQGDREAGEQLLAQVAQTTKDDAEWNRLVILAGTHPEDPNGHRLLARWCLAHKRYTRAAFEWQEVLSHLPADSEARRGLAEALAKRR